MMGFDCKVIGTCIYYLYFYLIMYKSYTESSDLFDVFKFESTNLFDDEPAQDQDEAVGKKRAMNGRKEYTNMRHVWTDDEIRKLLSVYSKQRGHIDMATLDALAGDMRKGITPAHINKWFKTLRAQQRKNVKVEKTHRRDARFTKAK